MKKFICPDAPDAGHIDAENLAQAKSELGCRSCKICDGGPVEYKDRDDLAAEKADDCAAEIRKIAGNPRMKPHIKRAAAAQTLYRLLSELGYPQVVEAYEEVLRLADK